MMTLYICVEGNIGVGKTKLVESYEGRPEVTTIYERFRDNPFLEAFYKEPTQHALAVELAFLTDRYLHLLEVFEQNKQNQHLFIADFSFLKCLVFARVNLDEKNFLVFRKYYNQLEKRLPKPAHIIYLKGTLEQIKANIRHRGRAMEQHISDGYLTDIEQSYRVQLEHQKTEFTVFGSTNQEHSPAIHQFIARLQTSSCE